jgi:hypothetical protein
MVMILFLTPRGRIALGMVTPMMWFTFSYLYSIWKITPTGYHYIVIGFFFYTTMFVLFTYITTLVNSIIKRRLNAWNWKLNRPALPQSNTEIDTNTLAVEIGERNRKEGLSRDI